MRPFGALIAAGAIACATGAAEPVGKYTINEDHPGYMAYRQYCASCHGVFANGKGPVAPVLSEPPTDLTRLADRYGSPLPKPKLVELVDGTVPILAHGSREMPVWGEQFFAGTPPGPSLQAGRRGMAELILDYLASVQR